VRFCSRTGRTVSALWRSQSSSRATRRGVTHCFVLRPTLLRACCGDVMVCIAVHALHATDADAAAAYDGGRGPGWPPASRHRHQARVHDRHARYTQPPQADRKRTPGRRSADRSLVSLTPTRVAAARRHASRGAPECVPHVIWARQSHSEGLCSELLARGYAPRAHTSQTSRYLAALTLYRVPALPPSPLRMAGIRCYR